ncbi:MAG: AAA family ATPase [Phycisphaerae bacterium]|nr:AAA family ATPase [Phycisphaerae bacterium]
MNMRRFWIVGPPGSGKSTVADRVAERLGVRAVHLDDLFWSPGWVQTPDEQMHAQLREVVAQPVWVIDGNYTRIRERYMDAVEYFVWLDIPLPITFARLFRRSIVRALTRRPCCNGNYESLRQTFLSRNSMLYYAVKTRGVYRKRYAAELAARPHVRLQNAKAVSDWLATQLP